MYQFRQLIIVASFTLMLTACHGNLARKETVSPSGAPVGASALVAKQDKEIRIHYLPVGAGMCHVVECPGTKPNPLLIDCGSSGTGSSALDLDKSQTIARVQALLNGKPAVVVMSHSDSDHSNYIPDILSPTKAQVATIWIGATFSSYPSNVKTWVNQAIQAGVPVTKDLPAGWHNDRNSVDDLACGTAPTYVLTVNSGNGANGASLMLSIDHGDTHAIFPGDATGTAQNSAIANYPGKLLQSEIVEASHHGADTGGSNDATWAGATKPRYLITSAGTKHYHPRCTAIQAYIDAGRVLSAPKHALQCGKSGGWDPKTTTSEAIYNTEDLGEIVITATDDPASVVVTCNGSKCSN